MTDNENKNVCTTAKAQYIHRINDLLKQCADITLIELIYQILLKSG